MAEESRSQLVRQFEVTIARHPRWRRDTNLTCEAEKHETELSAPILSLRESSQEHDLLGVGELKSGASVIMVVVPCSEMMLLGAP